MHNKGTAAFFSRSTFDYLRRTHIFFDGHARKRVQSLDSRTNPELSAEEKILRNCRVAIMQRPRTAKSRCERRRCRHKSILFDKIVFLSKEPLHDGRYVNTEERKHTADVNMMKITWRIIDRAKWYRLCIVKNRVVERPSCRATDKSIFKALSAPWLDTQCYTMIRRNGIPTKKYREWQRLSASYRKELRR